MAVLSSLRPFRRLSPSARFALQTFGYAFFFSCAIITFNDKLLETTHVDGGSMAPTLSPLFHTTGSRDTVAWNKIRPAENLQRGDVIFFANPTRPERNTIKRVVALEGDVVVLDPRRRPMRADGEVPAGRCWDAWQGRVVVPQGHMWVEGDNWRESLDSNWYGPISKSLIRGKAVSVVWPLSKFGAKPWEGWKGRTKVLPHTIEVRGSWKLEGEGVV